MLYEQGVDEVDDFIADVQGTPFFRVYVLLLFEYMVTEKAEMFAALDNIITIHSKTEDYCEGVILHNVFNEMHLFKKDEILAPFYERYIETKHYVYLDLYHGLLMVTLTHHALPTCHGLVPITNPLARQLQYRPIFKEAKAYEPLYPPTPAVEYW